MEKRKRTYDLCVYSEHINTVISTIQEIRPNVIINRENIDTYINSLSSNECAIIWKKTWRYGPRDDFCDYYGINVGNFNRFLNGKRSCPTACRGIVHFLRYGYDKDVPYLNKNVGKFDIKPSKAINIIKNKIGTLKRIFIIDGDNYPLSINILRSIAMIDLIHPTDDWNNHVIMYMSNGQKSSHDMGLESASWYTLIKTDTNISQATDMAISFLIGMLCNIVELNAHIYIVTNDKFPCELCSMSKYFEKNVSIITNEQSILGCFSDIEMGSKIHSMSSDQLRILWKSVWKDTELQFCKQYQIEQHIFNNWLYQKKPSVIGEKAVRRFLLEYLSL